MRRVRGNVHRALLTESSTSAWMFLDLRYCNTGTGKGSAVIPHPNTTTCQTHTQQSQVSLSPDMRYSKPRVLLVRGSPCARLVCAAAAWSV